ncbi:MAG: magnesium chelatase [Candidatus Blackburnbacteria bacterium RIFCSPHIGHO2_01_FULL_43_15b]|uniref:Magnesium chelatase n=1 Tax=Candidatus Blackburnbacteria bacterium RIFCSPHIGHO2_01_FULL_43_15b TaxID=1797513 RepID=A0A1G1V128_9BACT|nr:MAG: magnesium chelatase [Candidatus Blackburnbacteria bacterium RIFCSPHIGHO2_01_FULL_43_15b]
MLAKVFSGTTVGLNGVLVDVEVDIPSQGLPAFTIVGLGDKAVDEAKERVRAAIKNSGADLPPKRITVNLAPADLHKEGPAFDLPMAVGILLASEQLPKVGTSECLFIGELSLDGSLRHTSGVLPTALLAREKKLKNVFLPKSNAQEAAIIRGIKVYPVENLLQLFRHLSGTEYIEAIPVTKFSSLAGVGTAEFDFSEVQGQESAKRALEIAAAGGHNILMKGIPGSGKTMLARAFPGILPELTEGEALEVTKIYSITGNLSEGQSVVRTRPFRSPHHTISRNGLIGGGTKPMPGEISLAHRGALFLDEFAEFPRHVLEALRQPLEDGIVTISRAAGSVSYPAEFALIAAVNPCPCGYYGSDVKQCKCLPGAISRYQKRISGPILDRIDLHIDVSQVKAEKLIAAGVNAENSKTIQKRVQNARNVQLKRFNGLKTKNNAEMSTKLAREYCKLTPDEEKLMRQAISSLGLSARSYYKVLKVARTIADLGQEADIQSKHLSEALQFRPREEHLL